jgi:hypothetical protein
MQKLLEILVLALATWRLASLLAHEDGPFRIFDRLRELLGVAYAPDGQRFGTNWFAKGVVCLYCCSVWFGAILTGLYFIWSDVWWLLLPLALSAAAVIIEENIDGSG